MKEGRWITIGVVGCEVSESGGRRVEMWRWWRDEDGEMRTVERMM